MISIVACRYVKQTVFDNRIDFEINRMFSSEHNVKNYFVVLCNYHPFFKQRLGNVGVEDSCNCSNLFHEKTCQSCQTFCYVLNFIADKLIVDRKTEMCNYVELTHINDYDFAFVEGSFKCRQSDL